MKFLSNPDLVLTRSSDGIHQLAIKREYGPQAGSSILKRGPRPASAEVRNLLLCINFHCTNALLKESTQDGVDTEEVYQHNGDRM